MFLPTLSLKDAEQLANKPFHRTIVDNSIYGICPNDPMTFIVVHPGILASLLAWRRKMNLWLAKFPAF
jgi:hypothetical protein